MISTTVRAWLNSPAPARNLDRHAPAARVQFVAQTAREDRQHVDTIQPGPSDDTRPGHFDPYTGERVYRVAPATLYRTLPA